jgi:hypothetical protein
LANAQEDKEFVKGGEISNEEQGKENEDDVPNNSNGISQRLAHFVPMSPISNSPGNQLKVLLDSAVGESSPLIEEPISAVMEVYAPNGTLLRTSSLPEEVSKK